MTIVRLLATKRLVACMPSIFYRASQTALTFPLAVLKAGGRRNDIAVHTVPMVWRGVPPMRRADVVSRKRTGLHQP